MTHPVHKMIEEIAADLFELAFCRLWRIGDFDDIFTFFMQLKWADGVVNKNLFSLKLIQKQLPLFLQIGFGKVIAGKIFFYCIYRLLFLSFCFV